MGIVDDPAIVELLRSLLFVAIFVACVKWRPWRLVSRWARRG